MSKIRYSRWDGCPCRGGCTVTPSVHEEGITVPTPIDDLIVINPDELGPDPVPGMDLAVRLDVRWLEIRSAFGRNALLLRDEELQRIRGAADWRGLRVAALASPLFKWCRTGARPSCVDSFGFPLRVPTSVRWRHVERAIDVAGLLGTCLVRIFSHLRAAPALTESLITDPLLPRALAHARRRGVMLLVENEPVCTAATAGALLSLLERFEDKGLRLWLDLGNLQEVGDCTAAQVAALAPYVEYVHIKDYRWGGETRAFCPAGDGVVPYPMALGELGRHRPCVPYGIETHVRARPASAIAASVAYLRPLLRGTS